MTEKKLETDKTTEKPVSIEQDGTANTLEVKQSTEIPLLPLRNIIIFPNMVIPLFVGREKSIKALEEAMKHDQKILLCAQKNAKTNNPGASEIYHAGTISTILQLLKLPDGTVRVLIEGKERVVIDKFLSETPYFQVSYKSIKDLNDTEIDVETDALSRSLKEAFQEYLQHNKKIPSEVMLSISSMDDPKKLSDAIIVHVSAALEKRQAILEMDSVKHRLEELYSLIKSEIEIIKVEQKIKSRIEGQIEKSQKEYYLHEQMDAIQKELGKDDGKSEIFELEKQLKAIKCMPKDSKAKVSKEIQKLKKMSPMSAESAVVRNYIDWILCLPWDKHTKDNKDIQKAEDILNNDHYALEKVKERISEYLAVTTLVGKIKGSILCLCGPPGVGKTSLGESIARALNRKFVRVSLGGVRDEAEIRGHRRTYIGAMPGKIVQSMKKVAANNPVFMLDEIDKMSMDFRGDPSSALLEVLDPEQNQNFNDHYLEIDYDLSKVMFIATANSIHGIPRPLLDRMEVINLHGYTDEEKYHIANRYLVPRQLKDNGLDKISVTFSESSIYEIIKNYTKESGVRNLNREIAAVCRKVAKNYVHNKVNEIKVTVKNLESYLGPQKFLDKISEEESQTGLVNGLAWTELGGEILSIETSVIPGTGRLELTGQLGEVMQESAKAAFTYIRSKTEKLGLTRDFYKKIDIHLHIPEGAIPKDGPSAGITIATCLVSAILKIPVSSKVAMTGEITLRGRILAIGGLKEKVLAAYRMGIKKVFIPKTNKKDISDIPSNIRKAVDLVLVENIDEIMSNKDIFPKKIPLGKKTVKKSSKTTKTTRKKVAKKKK